MIESARQKNSAPIAKRVSGDGAFLSIQFIYFCVEFILQGVPLLAERSDATCIYKGTPCAHLFKKAVFCRVLSCLIV